MRARRAAMAMLAALSVGACAGPHGPAFRPEVVDLGRSVIYIYRPPRQWAGPTVGIYLDQRFLGRLDAGQYVACTVDPGERIVRVEAGGDAVREVDLTAGDSAYLEVHSGYWSAGPTIDPVDEQAARERIAQTGRAEMGR